MPGEEPHNERLRRAALALGLRCVATNAVHYAANITGHGWRKLLRHP